MTVELNHTIVQCRDKQRSATFLTEILGLPDPVRFGPFLVVQVDNGASLDFDESDGEIARQHYAFLIGEDDFDEIFGRIRDRGLQYWADPFKSRRGDQPQRRRSGRLFRRPRRPPPRGHHPPLRQRRLTATTIRAAGAAARPRRSRRGR